MRFTVCGLFLEKEEGFFYKRQDEAGGGGEHAGTQGEGLDEKKWKGADKNYPRNMREHATGW